MRNGAGYSLGMNYSTNPRDDEFQNEGHIMPSNLRQLVDPAGAPPEDFVGGKRGEKYALPTSAKVAHDNVGLVIKAHQNYVNYRNRFQLPNPNGDASKKNSPDQPESSISMIRGGSIHPSTRDHEAPPEAPPAYSDPGAQAGYRHTGMSWTESDSPHLAPGTNKSTVGHEKYAPPYV